MNEKDFYQGLCRMLMDGKELLPESVDVIKADNMLYADFGMSSEDILENFKLGFDTSLCK